MATLRPSTISLMLSIVLWGTLIGGIAYSHLVYFPPYLSALPHSAVVVNGPYGLHEVIFWMIIHPLLILSLAVTIILNWRLRTRRNFILISFVVYVLVIVISQIYFIPELIAFERSPESSVTRAEWLARSQRWEIKLDPWRSNVRWNIALTARADEAGRRYERIGNGAASQQLIQPDASIVILIRRACSEATICPRPT